MTRFLVTYHGSEMPHDPEAIAQARDAFIQWAGKTGAALVEPGDPIRSFKTIDRSGTREGAAEGPFNGWSVIEADDADAALQILNDHPFIDRGGQLQVSQPLEFPPAD
jgi:hypothetical protein